MGEVEVQSHNVSLTSYWLTCLWFHVSRPSHSWDIAISKFELKIQGQGHSSKSQSRYSTLSTHIPFIPCWSALPFLGYSYFKIWHWKFKVKVMGEVEVESHNMGPTFSWLTSFSFHVNWPSHSWEIAFSKFDLENWGSRSNDHDVAQLQVLLSRQFHRTSNGINPSSGFKDMGSTKSGPSGAWFDKFLAHEQAHIGQMGK